MSKEIDGMQMHLLPLDETCTPKYLKEARCELREYAVRRLVVGIS